MKYQKYEKYKDVEFNWLGYIPEHWKTTTLKRIVEIPITDGPHETPNFIDEGIPFISAEAVYSGKVNFDQKRGFISIEQHLVYSKKYKPEYNDVYLVKSGSTTGKVAIVDFEDEFNIWSPLAAIRCHKNIAIPKFIFYALQSKSFQQQVKLFWSFGTQPNIGMGVIGNLSISLPKIDEQQSIANFLDRETTRIDTLIEKKKKLIELLKEKRNALITKAVTKGLNPDVKMKDSGIEWLGEVPEHWEVVELKRLFKIFNGSTPESQNEEYWDGKIIWLTPDDLGKNNKKYIIDSQRKITEAGYKSCGTHLLPPESIILSTRAPIGHIGINSKEACTNQGCKSLVKRKNNIDISFYYYLLLISKQNLNSFGKGSTFMELPSYSLGKYKVPSVPLKEQEKISKYLDYELKRIDTLVLKIEQAITKHQEFRTTLISAAVTGKIKVPEE